VPRLVYAVLPGVSTSSPRLAVRDQVEGSSLARSSPGRSCRAPPERSTCSRAAAAASANAAASSPGTRPITWRSTPFQLSTLPRADEGPRGLHDDLVCRRPSLPRPYSLAGFVSPQRLQRRSTGAGFGLGPGRKRGSWALSGTLTAVSAAPFSCSRTSSETGPRNSSRTSASSGCPAGAATP
jgi:hypothetical protein